MFLTAYTVERVAGRLGMPIAIVGVVPAVRKVFATVCWGKGFYIQYKTIFNAVALLPA
jgi:hypothetical protein